MADGGATEQQQEEQEEREQEEEEEHGEEGGSCSVPSVLTAVSCVRSMDGCLNKAVGGVCRLPARGPTVGSCAHVLPCHRTHPCWRTHN